MGADPGMTGQRLRAIFRQGKPYSLCALLAVLILCACGTATPITRIALLAPFEGRYREVGYEALYAARLALQEWNDSHLELLAVDDGGTVESAVDRAHALAQDPQVLAVIALGYPATVPETQAAYGDLPVLIVGHWSARPETDNVFMWSSPDLDDLITTPPRLEVTDAAHLPGPITGDEILALEQFRKLRQNFDDVTIVSSAPLPDETFRTRYLNSAEFVPEPGLLAADVHWTTNYLLGTKATFERFDSRSISRTSLAFMLNLTHFKNGYRANAQVYQYRYDTDCIKRQQMLCLVAIEAPVSSEP